MARHLKIAAAQLGPLHKADSRAVAVSRLVRLLKDAHSMGAKFVVFPELALTTFFPRWWMEDQAEVDRRYFESTVPSRETQPLFDEAKKLGIGFYLGYAELTPEGRRFNTSILVGPDGSIVNCGPFTCGTFIGKIGPGGSPFFVGDSLLLTTSTAGELFLLVFDQPIPEFYTDNSGFYDVTISCPS